MDLYNMLAVLAWFLYVRVSLSMRVREGDDILPLVALLKGAVAKGMTQGDVCTMLVEHSKDLKDEQSIFRFITQVFALGSDSVGKLHPVAVLRCMAVYLKMPLNIIDSDTNETLLFPAVLDHQPKSVQYLLASGVPGNFRNSDGENAAELALIFCPECLIDLLTGGVNPNDEFQESCSKATILQDECQAGWNLVHFAAQAGAATSLKNLKQYGADFNAKDHLGLTPVLVAIRRGRLQVLSELGRLGASFFSVHNQRGWTPAHYACRYLDDSIGLVKFLATIQEFGGSLNGTNHDNQTPAHICASARMNYLGRSNPDALSYLHEMAIESFQVRDSNNRTPEEVAESEKGNVAEIFFYKIKVNQYARQAAKANERKHIFQKKSEEAIKCKELEEQVKTIFDCSGDGIKVPRGVMLMKESQGDCGKSRCAARCPNAAACPECQDCEAQQTQCADGYDDASQGCSRCQAGYGRRREDPFQCKACGEIPWLSWVTYVVKPLGIYLVSLWTAHKKRDRTASLLKIWMAFGIVMASISPSIKSSDTFAKIHTSLVQSVEAGEGAASLAAQMTGASFDCLLDNPHASMTAWLGLSFAPPLVLWLLTMIYVVGRSMSAGSGMVSALTKDALKVTIVSTNCFLPDMVAALVRFVPCIHFQVFDQSKQYLQFNVETQCSQVVGMRLAAVFAAILLGTVLGPVYWVAVIMKSKQWEDREEVLGFLISHYRDKVRWWEATVLIRKCALAVAVTLFSASYAPMLYLSSILLIVGLGLACHSYVLPYDDSFLNRLEFGTLMASFIAVFCTFLLQLEMVSWAVDDTVTIPAGVILVLVGTVPSLGLMVLYFMEIRSFGLQRLTSLADQVKSAVARDDPD